MKAIGIVGSPRKNGNTEFLTKHTLKSIAEEGLETELIRLAGLDIRPCTACDACLKKEQCPIKDDMFPIYEKMKQAEAIILASPVYFSSVSALLKGLMERAGFIAGRNGKVFQGKVGGPLVAARRAGQNLTHAQLSLWFHVNGFFMPGSTYWNIAFGRRKGDVANDEEGLDTVWNFGKNVAFLVKKLNT
jgi:multimeric flavodoxin WrbA